MKAQELKLDGKWQVEQVGANLAFTGRVPGDVLTDLVRAKKVPDPYYRENENEVQWVGEADWVYRRTFKASAKLLRQDRVLLTCDGLDTFATVRMNGKKVASTDNMFRRYAWDVKDLLQEGENALDITFQSVNPYTRKRSAERFIKSTVGGGHPNAYPSWVRKEQCNFGWDWGPVLVTAGIWRSIRLVGVSAARFTDIRIDQEHRPAGGGSGTRGRSGKTGAVRLHVSADVEVYTKAALRVKAEVSFQGKVVATQEAEQLQSDVQLELEVSAPALWWPQGMGAQPLYEVRLVLMDADGAEVDVQQRRIGLRTLRLDRHPDAWGESFQFVVNGIPFFAKGANWIPVDALLGRRTPDDYRRLLEDSVAANMNMLRVWGGGIYEDEVFYDLCDELGICVWQDFMFACMAYPSWDGAFMENVEAEASDNVRKLRHHPCLALWCGNNELEQQAVEKIWQQPGAMSWEDYSALFDDLLARVVREHGPQTDYWPCSPHSPQGDRLDFNNAASGDAHLWGVWHGKKPFEWYRTCEHRFNSEFGFQSFPEPRTVCGYTKPEDRNVTTAVMEHHQRSGIGNTTIMQYMLDWFRVPTSFEMTLWTSQILQGMAMKYACEHWRRSMPRGMGTLYWQLNDVWPVASWASIDYHGRWKALHYMARHFYAPILVSGLEDAAKGTIDIHITSDLLRATSGTLTWVVTRASGKKIRTGEKRVRTPVNGNRKVMTLKLADLLAVHGPRDLLVWLSFEAEGQSPSRNLVYFARPKHLELVSDPGIRATVAGASDGMYTVTLKTKYAALWCWLELEGVDARYSDNFVHIRPGAPVTVQVQPQKSLQRSEVAGKLMIRSVTDTYK